MMLRDQIKKHEGLRLVVYPDTLGNLTIGYGHLLPPTSKITVITPEEAERLLDEDIANATKDAEEIFSEFHSFSQNRQDCIIELLFNLGRTKFLRFVRMIHNINIGSWEQAANELQYSDGKSKLSPWYQQVKERRAEEMLAMIREG